MVTTCAISLGLFLFLVLGNGLLCVRALHDYEALERLVLTVFAGLIGLYLFGTVAYLYNAPPTVWRWGPVLMAAAGWGWGWREAQSWWRNRETFATLKAWGLVIAGGLLALAFIRNYSGGEWAADWVEHYQRALFFLLNLNPDFSFSGMYHLAARPPLISAVTATLMGSAKHIEFFYYQTFTTLISSCAVPAMALLIKKWRGRAGQIALLPLLLLANPMFVQNTSFPWTKLAAAAFTLAGFSLIWGTAPADTRRWLAAVLLTTAGVLTHYSAAPYALVMGAAYVWSQRRRWNEGVTWIQAARLAAAVGGFALTWFGWAVLRYGSAKVFGTNTTVEYAHAAGFLAQFPILGENLLRTLIPHPLLINDYGPFEQSSAITWWRDYLFCIYQVCLPFTLGLGGLTGFCLLLRNGLRPRRPLVLALGFLIITGVAANMAPMRWGVAHITLIPLTLAALALVAARWDGFSPGTKRIIGAGLVFDFVLGVGLQLYGEHIAIAVDPVRSQNYQLMHGVTFASNALSKARLHLVFAGDISPAIGWLLAAGAGLLVLILLNLRLECRRGVALSPVPSSLPPSS